MKLWSCLILSLWVLLSFQNCAKVGFSAENPSANGVAQGTDPSGRNDNDPDDPTIVEPPDSPTLAKIELCKLSLNSLAAIGPAVGDTIQNFALANEDHSGIYSEHIVNATLNQIFGIIHFYHVDSFKADDYQGNSISTLNNSNP